jgi:DeoR/GlpR family transcriptional regulator of sugar metabolism
LGDASISAKMIQMAKEVIIIMDHSKIGVEALCKISQFDQISAIVCDRDAPQSWKPYLENIEWITAD